LTGPAAVPQLIAHRGAQRERPENTLPSFLRALELGAEGIELDVHATQDGVVVVHNDLVPRARPPRRALGGRRIDELTFDEIQGFSVQDLALIPTLKEVLAVVRGRCAVYIEIKGEGIERQVVDVVRASPSIGTCAIHSFDHEAISRVHALASDIPTGILFDRAVPDPAGALRLRGARDLWAEWRLVDEALADQVHEAKGRLIAWTVNDPAVARRFAAIGVDAICTDALPALRDALSLRA